MIGRKVLIPTFGHDAFSFLAIGSKWVHNNVSWAFIVALVIIFVVWVVHNIPDRTDLVWLSKAGGLLGGSHPPAKKFNAGQKLIFWAVIMSMFIGNLVLLILNLPLIPYIAKVLAVPRNYLIPFILFFTLMGAYIGQNNATELLILVGFGVCATVLRFAKYPLAPLLIGFILGRMMEDNFARSMQLYDGINFIVARPMTMGLLFIAAVLVVLPSYRARLQAARAAKRD